MTAYCLRGHEYTPENTLLNNEGWRYCRACHREASKLRMRRRRAQIGIAPPDPQ